MDAIGQPPVRRRAVTLCPGLESEGERHERRRRWLAAAMRRAYSLDWVPPEIVANLVRIRVDPEHQAVILTLRSGTVIVDRQDRIDIQGRADDVAVGELVEAVRRRGWDAVELHGDQAFRRAAAIRLQLLDPPITVANSPLSDADQDEIERRRQARVQNWQGWPDPSTARGLLQYGKPLS